MRTKKLKFFEIDYVGEPSSSKFVTFLIIWFFLPVPVFLIVDPGGMRFELVPLVGPLFFFVALLNIVLEPNFTRSMR